VHFSWVALIIGIVLLGIGLSMIIARKWWARFASRRTSRYDVTQTVRQARYPTPPWVFILIGALLAVLGFLFIVGELLALVPQS
jgi:hypothetical protein